MSRIAVRFEKLAAENRAAFIPFVMAGDPDFETSLALVNALPEAGADLIELGVCFTDPMADGPAIQAAGLRALKAGQTLRKTLDLVRAFREGDTETPIVLMGYANPALAYGEAFLPDAKAAGVDGLIVVDLPPEEDAALCLPARTAGLDFIRLATPTTNDLRLPKVLNNTSGFVYYVSVAGVTGQKSGETADISARVAHIKEQAGLPVAVGFGVRTPEQAAAIARTADAVVVGSALVSALESSLQSALAERVDERDTVTNGAALNAVLNLTRDLARAVRGARMVK